MHKMQNFEEGMSVQDLIKVVKEIQDQTKSLSYLEIKESVETLLAQDLGEDFLKGFYFAPLLLEIVNRLEDEE